MLYILTYGTPRLFGIILNTKNGQFRRKLSNEFKITDFNKNGKFSEKSAIFIKFGGNSYQFYFKILVYIQHLFEWNEPRCMTSIEILFPYSIYVGLGKITKILTIELL